MLNDLLVYVSLIQDVITTDKFFLMNALFFFRYLLTCAMITSFVVQVTGQSRGFDAEVSTLNDINDFTLFAPPTYDEHRFLIWQEGESFEELISQFKGSVIYVDMWASWCRPCLEEAPYAMELKKELDGEHVVFLNVSVDEHEDDWLKAIDQYHITGYHIRLSESRRNPFQDRYRIKGYPTYLIFNKEGKLVKQDASWPSERGTARAIRKYL